MNRMLTARLRAFVVLLVLMMTGFAAAQDDAMPIALGQNLFGEVAVETPTADFALTVEGQQTVRVQVLSLSADYFPTLRVVNASGIEILNVTNAAQNLIVEETMTLGEAGTYRIEVGSAAGSGEFVVSVQAGAALPDPVELVAGERVEASVDVETPTRLYGFESAADEDVLLRVTHETGEGSLLILLRDETTAQMLSTSALASEGMRALTYRFAAGETDYALEVGHGGSDVAETYQICLWTASTPGACGDDAGGASNGGVVSPPAETAGNSVPSATADASAGCVVMSATGGSINVRRGPGTDYAVVGNLSGTQSAAVTGRLSNSAWYQVSYNGQTAWVGSTVVVLVGNCGNLPVVVPPVLPTQAQPPTANATPSATLMVTPSATLMATLTATTPPTATATSPETVLTLPAFEPQDERADLVAISFGVVEEFDGNGNVTRYRFHFVLQNVGYSDSGPFTIRRCFNGTCVNQDFGSLHGGGPNSSEGWSVESVIERGDTTTYLYEVYVDFYNDVNEIDETNNLLRFSGNTQD